MESKQIVVLGGGIMQIPVLKQAKNMGLRVLLVDGNQNCCGKDLADGFIHEDISDEDAVLEQMKRTVPQGSISGILTVGTDYPKTVSKMGEFYQTNVLPYTYALTLSDKSLIRKKLTDSGFAQPIFLTAEDEEEFCSAIDKFSRKGISCAVIKPVDSMGARGVKKINLTSPSSNKIESNPISDFKTAMSYSRKKKVILEEFISGREYSLDAIACGGKIQITGIADRIIGYSPYFVETGHVIPSQAGDKIISQLTERFTAAIQKLTDHQPISGGFKGDIFFTENGQVVVGEIAGRLSGGYMSGYTYPLSSGVNLMEAIIEISLGLCPLPVKEKQLGVVIEQAIISPPGKVTQIKNLELVKKSPGVEEVFIHVKPGDTVRSPKNNLMKSANLIVKGKNYAEACEYLKQSLEVFKVLTEDNL